MVGAVAVGTSAPEIAASAVVLVPWSGRRFTRAEGAAVLLAVGVRWRLDVR